MAEHPFMKGVGLGMLAGAAVGATMMKNEKALKRSAHITVKAAGRLAVDAAYAVADRLPK